MMMGMLKGNMMQIVPLLMFGWVNSFFSGFVVLKMPFPLTMSFKGMLQRGVDLQALDMSYVSAASWYFILMFGLRGIMSLILGEQTMDETEMMRGPMGAATPGTTAGGAPADMGSMMMAERENLEILQHTCVVEQAEANLLNSGL